MSRTKNYFPCFSRWIIFCTYGCIGFSIFAQEWRFEDVTATSGMDFDANQSSIWNGVSVADFDRDGWLDLFMTPDHPGPNRLFRNLGDGHFEDVAAQAGIALEGRTAISSLFFDYDGDGWSDLLIIPSFGNGDSWNTKMPAANPFLYRNMGNGTFEDVSQTAGFDGKWQVFSATAGDYDMDGDPDLYLAVNDPGKEGSFLWRNNGDGSFTNMAETSGLGPEEGFDFNLEFTPTFADINNDRLPDLLIVADFNNSQVYLNRGDGSFINTTNPEVITDEGGMGSAVGDYDNDGDLDWFVSSIWDPAQNPVAPWGVSSGNRLYRNLGNGQFEDATDEAGVREGFWGWGSSFADFNNDGHLDLFHTNGFIHVAGPVFRQDPARLWVANGDGSFTERSGELGIDDKGLGHGIACFDYDRDGDLDIFIANSEPSPRLYQNQGGNRLNSINIQLLGRGSNAQALGARVYLKLKEGPPRQMRELVCGNNFLSQNPVQAHFGMGSDHSGTVEVVWPNGHKAVVYDVSAGRSLRIPQFPYSFDDPRISFYDYLQAIDLVLQNHLEQGRLLPQEIQLLRGSALRGFLLERLARTLNL